MSNNKIKQLNINDHTYDIDLPSDATPTITSLKTLSGVNLTEYGTVTTKDDQNGSSYIGPNAMELVDRNETHRLSLTAYSENQLYIYNNDDGSESYYTFRENMGDQQVVAVLDDLDSLQSTLQANINAEVNDRKSAINSLENSQIKNLKDADGTSSLMQKGENQYGTPFENTKTGCIAINANAPGVCATMLGGKSLASGKRSLAEGTQCIAQGNYSHAEGNNTYTEGGSSHAEGLETGAYGSFSHSEGNNTNAKGNQSHSEGNNTNANGENSHSEGQLTTASGLNAHSEGYLTEAAGEGSHAEGYSTKSQTTQYTPSGSGGGSGIDPTPVDPDWDIEKQRGKFSHTEGVNTIASGWTSHAEGAGAVADGHISHAEGESTLATGRGAHAEGAGSIASGDFSHAEGSGNQTKGKNSFATGKDNIVSGENSAAFGDNNTVSSNSSIALGGGLSVTGYHTAAVGAYNNVNSTAIFQVGNGSSNAERKTAFEVLADGRAKLQAEPTDDDDIVRYIDLNDSFNSAYNNLTATKTMLGLENDLKIEITSANLTYGIDVKDDPTGTPVTYTFDSTLAALNESIGFKVRAIVNNELKTTTYTSVSDLIRYITHDLGLTSYACELDYYGVKFKLDISLSEENAFQIIGGHYSARSGGSSTILDILPYQGNNSNSILKVVYYHYITQK